MKFFHTADVHLDSPLCGLDRYDGAPVDKLRGATRRALESLVDECVAEKVDFLLIAGDLYDGDWTDYNTGIFFIRQMARLRDASIRVFIVRGNHDAKSKILSLPEGVVELSTSRAESITLEDIGVCIHGRGYARVDTKEDLSQTYPAPRRGQFNIGLLHTAAGGREGHADYAPCTPAALANKGYDYWALGHVHKREVLLDRPWIVFPGNLQGRHARETGPKGATLVTVEDGRIEVEHKTLDVARWAVCQVDASSASTPADVVDLCRQALLREMDAAGERALCARIVVSGASRAHAALTRDPDKFRIELCSAATDIGDVWIEKANIRTRTMADLDKLAERDDPLGALLLRLRAIEKDDTQLVKLAGTFDDIAHKLPPEYAQHVGTFDPKDLSVMRRMVSEMAHYLLPELVSEGDAL
ncbi:MAG TPA: DNA repair exonuclease [Polyangium sp.]|nr:DNA repair exonuclease [Polyangium sp.]